MERAVSLNVDAELRNADWTKQSWDLPFDTEAELEQYLKAVGMSRAHWNKLPVAAAAPWLGEGKRAGFDPNQARDPGGEGGGEWVYEESTPSADFLTQVTGRRLKVGDRFWITSGGRTSEYRVSRDIGQYLRVVRMSDGRQMMLKRGVKVDVLKTDFPEAAKAATRPVPMHVKGELGKVFSRTPGKTNPVTLAAQEASDELAAIGITLPEPIPEMGLKITKAGGVSGQFRMQKGKGGAVAADMFIRQDADEAMASTVHHEFGHYLDGMVLPYETPGVSYAPGVEPPRRGFVEDASSIRNPDVTGPVMDAIDSSRAAQRRADMANRPRQYAVIRDVTTSTQINDEPRVTETSRKQYPIDGNQVRYLDSPSEKFARAYEQYVSTKAGKRSDYYAKGAAYALDDYYLEPGEDSKGFYGWYWDDEDFKPIEREMDAMFRRLGWSKS
jgi:hypothetical protein